MINVLLFIRNSKSYWLIKSISIKFRINNSLSGEIFLPIRIIK
jgi:hypothetical protein